MAKPSPKYSQNPSLVALGATIRIMRSDLNMSQESLALAADLDRSYLGGIERGEHNLSIVNVTRIAKALNIKLSELLLKSGL